MILYCIIVFFFLCLYRNKWSRNSWKNKRYLSTFLLWWIIDGTQKEFSHDGYGTETWRFKKWRINQSSESNRIINNQSITINPIIPRIVVYTGTVCTYSSDVRHDSRIRLGKTKAKGNVGSGGISLTIHSVPNKVKVALYAPYNLASEGMK